MNKEAFSIRFIHVDTSFVVVEKPGGLLSVPGRGPDKQDCVAGRVKALFRDCIAQPAVHRLDMQTSGLMVLALTSKAHRLLSRQFESRQVEKRYIALLEGVVEHQAGEIRLPFRLDPDNRPYQIHDPLHGKTAITLWKRLSVAEGKTRVVFTPLTGRTHQLRVHAAHPLGLGCPIIGDRLYGHGRDDQAMLLHACFLAFRHPLTGEAVHFSSTESF